MEPALAVVIILLCVIIAILCTTLVLLFLRILKRLKSHENRLQKIERNRELYYFSKSDYAVENETIDSDAVILRMQALNRNSKCSVVICENANNVYGEKARLSQLYELAQINNKERNQRGKPLQPIDEIQMKFNDPNDQIEYMKNKRETIFKEMSALASVPFESATNADNYEKSIFVQKEIGQEGGKIEMNGVILELPPGSVGKPIKLTMGIIWDETIQPKLTRKESRLSPIVICEPSMHFAKPVVLTLPHCAQNTDKWNWKVLKREGNLLNEAKWMAVTADDFSDMHITESRITISLHHFTLYTLIGESKSGHIAAKAVQLVAFTPVLVPGSSYETKIYCINDYGKEIKEVRDTEREIKRKLADGPIPLFVHDDGSNIEVLLSNLSEGWDLQGDKIEELDFELIWHALSPSCKFIYEPKKLDIRQIRCEYESYQTSQLKKKTKLKITDEVVQTFPKALLKSDDHVENVRRKLIMLLDPEVELPGMTGNWKDLARKIGLTEDKIRWLAEQRESPTEILLNLFEVGGEGLQKLRNYLIQIERPDAASELDALK